MHELHYPTLSLIIAAFNGVSILVMLALWHINRDVPGPGVWAVSALCSSLGFAAVMVRPQLGPLTLPFSNGLLMGAALLHIEGLLRFKGLAPARWRWVCWLSIAAVATLISAVYANDARMRYRLLDPLVALTLLSTAALLWWRTQGRWRVLYGVCAMFVSMASAALLLRTTLAWQAPAGVDLQAHPVLGLVFLMLLTHQLAWVCGMSLAVNLGVQERLQQMALNDPLTGLANRRQLETFVVQALRRAQRRGDCLVVVLMDLDGFKSLNDRHGHAAGDGVLREVAARARQATRNTDLVARLGGDEFVVVIEAADPAAVAAAVARLQRALNASPLFDGPATTLGVSMGVASYPEDGDNLVALLREADGRMYGQKRERAHSRLTDSAQASA